LKRFSAIWKYSSGTGLITDLTANTNTNTAFTFISAATETFYFGANDRMMGLYVDLSTNGSYTGLVFEYKSDSGWKSLQLIDSYLFTESKYLRWLLPEDCAKFNFTNTDPYSTTPPDNVERYWIRVSCSTVTTAAVISKVRAIPYIMYTSVEKVAQFMQLPKSFDSDTHPNDLTVEDFIRRAEDRIDYMTKKSWRFNAITEEYDPQLTDYNRYGIFLRHRNFTKVYGVYIWTGSEFQKLTEGRTNDYFINYDLGMIYFTRLFLLPAAYGMTGRYFHWGFGEYKFSTKVDYVYGRDWEQNVHRENGIIESLATKIAAKDLWTSHDYSDIIISGSDKVPLESKLRTLDLDIEKQLEELTGIAIY
jgi:hypothetical protein